MGKRAVLVGCNYPGTEFELGGSVNDVKTVKEMLIDTYGFKEEHIRVFVDVKGVFKKNTIPTGKSIKRALKDLLKGSAKGDALVFHFSGHGGVIPSDEEGSSDGDNLQSFLLPTDYNILTSDDFKKILTKFPLTDGATFTVIADASQSDGLLEGHCEMINPPQPPRTLLRRIKEEAEEEAEEEAVVAAKSTGESTAATEGAQVSNTVALETPAPAADESVEDNKAATVKPKEVAPTPVKEPAASAAKEAVPAVKEALPVAAATAAKESATATAAVKQPAAPKKSATAVAKEGPAAGHAKSTGTASTKPAVSAKGAAAVSTKAGAAANAKHAAAAPTRPAPTKPAPAAPAKADTAAPVTTVSKSLTVEVTEKPAPTTVSEPTANGTAEDSAPGATTKPGTEQESAEKAVVTEAKESVEAEKEAGNEATRNDTAENLTEVPPKVVGPQARQIALDSFLDALSQKTKKKAAKGSIRRSLHDAFGDSSSRTVKNYVQKLRRQKSSPIHRRGLSALMEIFACGGIAEAQPGKVNQAAGKGPANVDSDESRTMDLGPHEEIEHIQSCILLTAARRNQDVHDNGENGLFTDTLVKVVKKHKADDSLESLSNYHLISCVADMMTNDTSIEQKPGLECSDINVGHPFILGRKQEEPKAAVNGEAEDKKGEESAAESKQESSADTNKSAAAEATEEPKEGDGNSQKPEVSTANVKENGVAKEAKEAKPVADKAQKKTEAAASK